ncbi:MAG: MgtC/SapB family protein [Halorhodospira sp.]
MDEIRWDVFGALGVALAVGLLIGLERGWNDREAAEGQRVAGLRTFALIGLLGGVSALLADTFGGGIIGFGFVALAVTLTVAHLKSSRRTADYGITSQVASLATFALGATAVAGHPAPAAAGAVITATLLGLKPELHEWLRRLNRRELIAALQLGLISVVVLPLLPDVGYGPGGALNPYALWWLVVLITAISFIGHFAIRVAGERRGLLFTGLAGGLASSTALTLSFARIGRERAMLHPWLAVGVVVAASTMFLRMLVEVALVNPDLLIEAVSVLGAMAVAGFGLAGLILLRPREAPQGGAGVEGVRPFQLKVALQFAAVLAVIGVLSEVTGDWLGDRGLYLLALLSGVADVDAITLSLARMTERGLAPEVAVRGMVLAAMINTAVKALMVVVIAGGRMALQVTLAAAGMIGCGALVLLLRLGLGVA